MTGESYSRRLRIPVRFIDGVIECEFGGPVPVRHNTQAELLVERSVIDDPAFLRMMEMRTNHKVLSQGTALLVALTIKPEATFSPTLKPLLIPYDQISRNIDLGFEYSWSPHTVSFVEIRLSAPNEKQSNLFETNQGGLWLTTLGLKAIGLTSTTIQMPKEISPDPVASLNHAYTKLSEIFETWRISHTGNVYSRVFYQENNGKWYPLDLLRNAALDKQDKEIAKGLWKSFMEKMKLATT